MARNEDETTRLPGSNSYSLGAQKIMLAAERLIGERGVEGVSVREIIRTAGQANNSAVYHHFGSKRGLIQAVFEMRMPLFDAAQRRRLDAAEAAGPVGVLQLLEALWLPLAVEFDDGQRTFARFLSQLAYSFPPTDHPVNQARHLAPTAAEIDARLRDLMPNLPEAAFQTRLRLIAGFVLMGLAEHDHFVPSRRSPSASQNYRTDLLRMAAAAFSAPSA